MVEHITYGLSVGRRTAEAEGVVAESGLTIHEMMTTSAVLAGGGNDRHRRGLTWRRLFPGFGVEEGCVPTAGSA